MALAALCLPMAQEGCAPVEFFSAEKADFSSWCTSVTVAPYGPVYCQRLELITRLHGEAERFRCVHEDPQSMDHWTSTAYDEDDESASDEEPGAESRQQTSWRKKKFVKLSEEELQMNWYDVLNVPTQEGATMEQIRQAYRRRCLETHPDKQRNHSDELFKKVQRAFDILGDPDARRTYDSSRPFDDSIPGDVVAESAFYDAFGPVFERNKKWCCEGDLPSLGDDTTPYCAVMRFYERWGNYQSWRDFSHMAEIEEIDDGMSREERRFYLRENERQLAQFNRQELRRIRTLVERARKNDPRLRRKRNEDEAKRQKEQADRDAFRRQLRDEEERRRALKEAGERSQREEAARKAQEEKSAVRQALKDLTAFLAAHQLLDETPTNKILPDAVRRPNLVWLFSKFTTAEEAQSTLESVRAASTARLPLSGAAAMEKAGTAGDSDEGGGAVEAVRVFNALVHEREKLLGVDRYGEALKKVIFDGKKPSTGDGLGGDGSSASLAEKKTPCVEWTNDDLNRLQKATAKYPPGTVERWSKIVVALRSRFTEEQAMAKVNELTAALHTNAHSSCSSGGGGAAATAAGAATAVATPPLVEDWTIKQQKQLEQGLRELKDYKEKDKFQKISKMVDSKTAKECFERYKFLCAVNRRK